MGSERINSITYMLGYEDLKYISSQYMQQCRDPIQTPTPSSDLNCSFAELQAIYSGFMFLGCYRLPTDPIYQVLTSLNFKELCKTPTRAALVLNLNGHWTVIFISFSEWTIKYFDSLHEPMPELLQYAFRALQRRFPFLKVEQSQEKLQQEGENLCGLYVLWFVLNQLCDVK